MVELSFNNIVFQRIHPKVYSLKYTLYVSFVI